MLRCWTFRAGVYYPHMASIEKRRADRTYYYLVESARVDGKPRIVSQQYLGSAAEVVAKLADASTGSPVRVSTSVSVISRRCGRCWRVWVWRRWSTRWCLVEATRQPRWAPTWSWPRRTGWSSRAQSWPSPTGGPPPLGHGGCAQRSGVGPPPVLGGDGPSRRGRPRGDRDPTRTTDGRRVRPGPVRAGAGHDQLRHVHRLRQRARPDRAARQGQTEAGRPAAGRAGPGGHPRRRGAAALARLPRRPARRHPVQHGRRRAGGPLPRPVPGCRR